MVFFCLGVYSFFLLYQIHSTNLVKPCYGFHCYQRYSYPPVYILPHGPGLVEIPAIGKCVRSEILDCADRQFMPLSLGKHLIFNLIFFLSAVFIVL